LAFLIRGLTGFGSGLIMVPLILLLLEFVGLTETMKLVVPTAALLAVLSGVLLISTFHTRKWIRRDVLLMMVIGALFGMVLGTYILASYEGRLLKQAFGVFLAIYSLKMLIGSKNKSGDISNYLGLLAGFLGGVLGGMFGTGGPPVIIYLNRKIQDKMAFRATLILYFLIINSWQCVTLCYTSLINWGIIKFTLTLLPAFIIGNIIGSVLHIRINQTLFNRVVAIVLLLSGIFLIISKSTPDQVQYDPVSPSTSEIQNYNISSFFNIKNLREVKNVK
jgi:hypothetical protein